MVSPNHREVALAKPRNAARWPPNSMAQPGEGLGTLSSTQKGRPIFGKLVLKKDEIGKIVQQRLQRLVLSVT